MGCFPRIRRLSRQNHTSIAPASSPVAKISLVGWHASTVIALGVSYTVDSSLLPSSTDSDERSRSRERVQILFLAATMSQKPEDEIAIAVG